MNSGFATRPTEANVRIPLDSALSDPQVERHIEELSRQFRKDAAQSESDPRTLEVQFRLHVPRVPVRGDENSRQIYEEVRANVISRSALISQAARDARTRADYYNLSSASRVVGDTVTRGDGARLPLDFRHVMPSIGMSYQKDIHYLRAPRTDTVLHFGAFEPDAKYPILYLAFSPADRDYIDRTLNAIRPLKGMVLTRVVSILDLPYNLMSRTLSVAIRELRAVREVDYVETAYNPYLGFNGASFKSANFHDLATAPVHYYYDRNGAYTTRRTSAQHPLSTQVAERPTPENVISVLAIDKHVRTACNGVVVPKPIEKGRLSSHPLNAQRYREIYSALADYRNSLELGWSARTVHPAFAGAPAGSPRGQCGVTSVWLARELRSRFRVEATYCYGELRSDYRNFESVDSHCWLEIGDKEDPQRIVVDLTADQADGFDRPIVMASSSELEREGVRYIPRIRRSLDELSNDSVWPRFLALSDALSLTEAA